MTDIFKQALAQINKEIAAQTGIIDAATVRRARLQATKIGLENALGQQEQAEIAWTDLVRTAIRSYAPGQQATAVQVRDTLKSWGYDFAGVSNPLALVNTCLQRLAEYGEVKRSKKGRPFLFGRRK